MPRGRRLLRRLSALAAPTDRRERGWLKLIAAARDPKHRSRRASRRIRPCCAPNAAKRGSARRSRPPARTRITKLISGQYHRAAPRRAALSPTPERCTSSGRSRSIRRNHIAVAFISAGDPSNTDARPATPASISASARWPSSSAARFGGNVYRKDNTAATDWTLILDANVRSSRCPAPHPAAEVASHVSRGGQLAPATAFAARGSSTRSCRGSAPRRSPCASRRRRRRDDRHRLRRAGLRARSDRGVRLARRHDLHDGNADPGRVSAGTEALITAPAPASATRSSSSRGGGTGTITYCDVSTCRSASSLRACHRPTTSGVSST
jgi:hypothetical protein